MARIPLDPPRSLVYRLTEWYSRRKWGVVADPAAAMGHNPKVLLTNARFEMSLDKWHRLDPTLKYLAEMAASVSIGSSIFWIASVCEQPPADSNRWQVQCHVSASREIVWVPLSPAKLAVRAWNFTRSGSCA